MKSIDDRYKNALIEEHDSYVRVGRSRDAKEVARVLKEQYGYDVTKQDDEGDTEKTETPDQAPERADADKAPENTAEPKPRRGRPRTKQDPASE